MQARGYAPEDCIAVGDSREDMEAAEVVGTFWLVANALERDPDAGRDRGGRAGVRVATESYGAGVYEAVVTTLAEREAAGTARRSAPSGVDAGSGRLDARSARSLPLN